MIRMVVTILTILISVGVIFSQTLTIEPYGVSPAAVIADTLGNPNYLGIKERVFSGLANVGVETKVYLIGTFEDSSLTIPVWNMYEKPAGSAAELSAAVTVDEASEIVTFIADQVGTYRIEISEGIYGDTVVINAAKYLSVSNCAICHDGGISSHVGPWSETGHATFLDRALDGVASSHYNSSCISCHTTGYDLDAANDGFDDFEFVFPDTLFEGMADSMYAEYPDAMKLANIQCESCHGPGSAHWGATEDSKIVSNLGPDNCAVCHDDAHYHVYPSQWEYSKHASGDHLYDASYSGGSCAPCHNGQGFIDYVNAESQTVSKEVPITCATCHDPHDATNEYQLRKLDVTLVNGEVVTEGGLGKLCMNCHKSRRDGIEYTDEYLDNLSSHYGPHHGPQADLLLATNVPTFGETLPTSPHLQATEKGCVDCHMFELGSHGEHDDEGNLNSAGMHSFSMVDKDGEDNVAACADCHGDIGDSFADKKFYLNGNADHDGNGVAEGLQHEVHGLLDKLKSLLPQNEDGEVSINDSSVTLTEARAGYNYFFIEEDRSLGIHNPAFAVKLLQASIKALGGVGGIYAQNSAIPMEYTLSQNYPNPFNPSTEIEFSIKKAGKVTLKVYDMVGREVKTLVDNNMAAGVYKARFDATSLASGVYIYRLVAGNGEFSSIKKMVLVK